MRIFLRALLCVLQKDDRRFLSTHTITTTYTYQFWTLLFGVADWTIVATEAAETMTQNISIDKVFRELLRAFSP